ncbi:hypothetical protein [Desulfitobacterium sp.]|uniref:Phosphatidic acid phosphatase type 2/haloperoxidase domain-containing protein n=1 Tax=bioreactor metagenome TaxID=1076179 RepID=A0A645GQF1_9ZZZZ|nr:hypothetical protein [Desulfitobacterium sp.]MEA4903052.1 hypothetical protein [Desulfitobacterium sp.]
MTKKEEFAKIIRAITVPPLLVLSLLIILFYSKDAIFKDIYELAASITFLVLIPVAAYPLALVIPKYKDKKREGQRNLAFILSLVGYIAAVIYGVAVHVSQGLLFIYLTYFISVVVLIVFNKIIKLRASGHACSITGPLILTIYFIGWKCFIWCLALFALITWASLILKRHTPKELIFGSTIAVIAFTSSLLFV